MKTLNEIKQEGMLTKVAMLRTLTAREHYKTYARFGHILPTTAAQLNYFMQKGICLDVLGLPDCEKIAEILASKGIEAHFQLTKSKKFARLTTPNYWLWQSMAER